MTHGIYTESALAKLSISQLQKIASELGATPTGDEQQRDSWVDCILLHQSVIAPVSSEVPTELIEEKTLELLGVEIVDRQNYIKECVPHGDIRFWVYRFDELIGTISTWYEHWIVSDWLAQKLAAKGSMVATDIYGLTVWGRCTTGQAICMDGVIGEIYRELHEID